MIATLSAQRIRRHFAAGWDFVGRRFADQGRALARAAKLPIAVANETVATCHGFDSWSELAQLCNRMSWLESTCHEIGGGPQSKDAGWCDSVLRAMGDLTIEPDVTWRTKLLAIIDAPLATVSNDAKDDEEEFPLEGYRVLSEIREDLLYQSLHSADELLASKNAWLRCIDFAESLQASEALRHVAEREVMGYAAQVFGLNSCFLGAPEEILDFIGDDPGVRQSLRTGRTWSSEPDDEVAPVRLQTLRSRLKYCAPGMLDGSWDEGPVLVLAIANCAMETRATLHPSPGGVEVGIFFDLFVPEEQDLVGALFCSPRPPDSIGVLTLEEAREHGDASLAGWFKVEWS
jgi:hypothetical protein